ncbi:MAG: hypothetical protein Q4D16_11485 [Eubacteriales bacterium]|nr:hypothetical protein [Eubacteriales bacterium]
MKKSEDRFGINIITYCRDHEKYIEVRLAAGEEPEKLLEWHEKKLGWLQHERLIHLMVTILTTIAFIFSAVLAVYLEGNTAALFLALILFVLLAAYLAHYFRLENRVQHWYRIAEQLHDRSGQNKKL